MKKDIIDKCRELWIDEDYKQGLEKLVEYRLMTKMTKILETKIKEEDWFSTQEWYFNRRKRATLGKKKWYPRKYSDIDCKTRIWFKINPITPTGDSKIAVKIHHENVTQEKGGIMDENLHDDLRHQLHDVKPEEFNNRPKGSSQYIRALCHEEFKPENYDYLIGWTVERLRELNNKCSPIIDEHIEKALNE